MATMPEDEGGTKTNHLNVTNHIGHLKHKDVSGHGPCHDAAVTSLDSGGIAVVDQNDSAVVVSDGKTVAPSMIQGIDVNGAGSVAVMSLAQMQNAGLLQAAGLGNLGDTNTTAALQAAFPVMIQAQGFGGTGPLAFIYPFSSAVVPTTSTVTTNENTTTPNVIVQPAGIGTSGVITVAPQGESEASSSPGISNLLTTDFDTQPGSSRQATIDLQQFAQATAGSLHNAITNQIIMEIKNEALLPQEEHTISPAPQSTDALSPPPPTTPDEDSAQGFFSKPKRPKLSVPGCKEDKLCRVCGDRALGCNFDAISCESCKAFFRRNALKEKQPKCLFEGNCKIDLNTRRFCPFCRLQKCLAIGMKKELILREDEKRKRQQKVMKNREKRTAKGTCQSPTFQSPLTPGPSTPNTPAPPGDDDYEQLPEDPPEESFVKQPSPAESPKLDTLAGVSGLVGMGQTLGGMSFSVAGSGPSHASSIPSTAATAPEITNLLSLSKFAQKSELSSSMQLDTFLVRRLTSEENRMLQELMQVYDLSFTVDLEPLIHIKHLDPSLNQLVNQSSITVLRLIKFAKRLEEFVRLTQECQIGILKCTWIHILLLRSVSLYDSERDVWVTPKGDIPTEILKNATGFVKLHDDHIWYCKSIKMIIRDDLMIVVILLVIVLFSPEGPNVINRELVSNIQDKYLILLKHYLESKYTYVRAAEMYPALMSKIRELKEVAERHGKYLLDVNPSEIEPIMLEILDLK